MAYIPIPVFEFPGLIINGFLICIQNQFVQVIVVRRCRVAPPARPTVSTTKEGGCLVNLVGSWDPVLGLAASFITHALFQTCQSRFGSLVCHYFVARVEEPITVSVTRKGLLRVLDKVPYTKSISARIKDGHPARRNAIVCKVMPREGIPVCDSEARHLDANQKVLDSSGQIIRGVALNVVWDGTEPDQDRQQESLPIRGKNDKLDAQEFGHRPKGFEIVVHANPEQTEGVEADGHADVVYQTAPEISRIETDITLLVCSGGFHYDGSQSQEGFQPRILQNAALNSQEGVWIGNVDRSKKVV